jgi:hypothetical protein
MMRKLALGVIAIVVASITSVGAGPRVEDGPARNKVEGTWEHTFENQPRLKQIKVINQDHFIWVTYDRETKRPVFSAGGTYTLDGDSYTEQVEFGLFGVAAFQDAVGKEHPYDIKIVGNTMTVIDTPTQGQKLREVWRRVSPQ